MNMLNIDAFKNSGLTGYVMLNETGGNDAAPAELVSTGHGHITNRLDRWFNTAHRQNMSHAVLYALHQSLSQRYVEEKVERAMLAVFHHTEVDQAKSGEFSTIGHTHQRVTAEQIREVLARLEQPAEPVQEAVAQTKAALAYDAKGVTCRIGNGEAKRLAVEYSIDAKMVATGKIIHEADQLVASDPGLGGQVDEAKRKIDDVVGRLQEAKRDIDMVLGVRIADGQGSPRLNMLRQMQADIAQRLEDLNSAREYYDDLLLDPVSKKSAEEFLATWQRVGDQVIDTCTDKNGARFDDETKARLKNQLKTWLDDRLAPAPGHPAGEFNLKRAVGNIRGDLTKKLTEIISKAGGKAPEKLERKLKEMFASELNQKPWATIRKELVVGVEDGNGNVVNRAVTSVITPAKHIAGSEANLDYTDVNGVMCHCTKEKKHSVNLAQSQLMVADRDGDSHEIFNGIRHGVLSAHGLPKNERRSANQARAVETAKAAFLSRPDLIAKALANPDEPVPMNLTSVSLLTTVNIARACKEGTMTKEQEQAWADIDGQLFTVKVRNAAGREVEVRVQPVITNFTFSSNPPKILSHLPGNHAVGMKWGNVETSNAKAFVKFMTRVDAFLAENAANLDPDVKKKCKYVSMLRSQLRTIWDEKTYKLETGGAYKASARVAVMSYLMGDVPCWNCKSGKDRTGMMDAECKHLALLVEQNRDIPLPGAKPSKADDRLFRDMVLKTGNLEMQQYNTGLAGYKALGEAKTVKERLGAWLSRAKGASKYAKS